MNISYAKFYTSMLNDEWFVSLSCNARGLWMQLILIAKQVGDTGVISMRSYSAMAAMCGCDDSSAAKYLRNFAEAQKVRIMSSEKSLTIEIVNYSYYQRGDVVSDRIGDDRKSKSRRKMGEKSPYNKTILDKTNIDSAACADRSVFQEIIDHYNLKTKRNWSLTDSRKNMLKSRLKQFTVEQLKDAIDGITSRPHNLGQNQTNTVYLDFELIFRSDAQVDKYRQDRVAKKPATVKYYEPPIVTPEQAEASQKAKQEMMKELREKGVVR